MTIQEEINNVLKTGNRKIEEFNGIKTLIISNTITTNQSLRFADFLRSIAKSQGRNDATSKSSKYAKVDDWYQISDNSHISIIHYWGKTIANKENFLKIEWCKDLGL